MLRSASWRRNSPYFWLSDSLAENTIDLASNEMSYPEMSTLLNSESWSQQIVVSLPSAVGGLSWTSRAPGTYDVYWNTSPLSPRVGRCRMMSESTLPSGP